MFNGLYSYLSVIPGDRSERGRRERRERGEKEEGERREGRERERENGREIYQSNQPMVQQSLMYHLRELLKNILVLRT